MQEVKDQLTSENMVLGGKLASLEEFKVQKEDLMAKFAKLEKELEGNKMEHKDIIYNLERKAVVDKDRYRIHFQRFILQGATSSIFYRFITAGPVRTILKYCFVLLDKCWVILR